MNERMSCVFELMLVCSGDKRKPGQLILQVYAETRSSWVNKTEPECQKALNVKLYGLDFSSDREN